MKLLLLLLLLPSIFAHSHIVQSYANNTTYTEIKKQISTRQIQLQFKDTKVQSQYLQNSIVDSLIPYWYGTPWTFSGYSEIPQQGTIACSYFVSTVLRDAGFNLNRYKMAQLHSFEEVKKFSSTVYHTYTKDSLLLLSNTIPDGIYLLGLDNHIGFLNKKNATVEFIHSNYLEPTCVMKEKIESSVAIANSYEFYVGAISSDTKCVKRWLQKTRIEF